MSGAPFIERVMPCGCSTSRGACEKHSQDQPDCRCKHPEAAHADEPDGTECLRLGCDCVEYRP